MRILLALSAVLLAQEFDYIGVKARNIIGKQSRGPIATHYDTADKVSPIGLERIGRTLTAWLERTAKEIAP